MFEVKIYDKTDNDKKVYGGPTWGVTDAMVALFFPNGDIHYNQEVYDACCELGDAITKGEPTQDYEAYLGLRVE